MRRLFVVQQQDKHGSMQPVFWKDKIKREDQVPGYFLVILTGVLDDKHMH